jgi:cyclopropane-fatty-acyl-phospholipid synthase
LSPRFFTVLPDRLRNGSIPVHRPGHDPVILGSGVPQVTWRFHDLKAIARIARDPDFELGETYTQGAWDTAPGELPVLLRLLMTSFDDRHGCWRNRLDALLRPRNRIARAYRNVAHHYDIDEWLFRRFLDPQMFYSCAYFRDPGMSLEQAQQEKCRLIMNKLLLQPGQRILDIGCGWGGLALYLARHANVEVTGLTLSTEQLRIARERAKQAGLSDRVQFLAEDYREHRGDYPRIVSVGMFEHVGRRHYPAFFSSVSERLTDDGIALLHTIGTSGPAQPTNPWVHKHIFPGGYNPSLPELSSAIANSPLLATDIEVLRLHYAETLKAWFQRLETHQVAISERFDERFFRTWQFYLAASEGAFRWWQLVVYQVQLAKQNDSVPLTRDYLIDTATSQAETE